MGITRTPEGQLVVLLNLALLFGALAVWYKPTRARPVAEVEGVKVRPAARGPGDPAWPRDAAGRPVSPGSLALPPGPDARRRAGRDDPAGFLDRFANSYHPDRSGELFYVVEPGYFLTLDHLAYNHGSPWDYDARVPLVFYGPGQVAPGSHRGTGAQSYDIPATLAAALGIDPPAESVGNAHTRVLVPGREVPRALVVVVMDQVGAQDVARFARVMPNLSRLRREGADFPDVTIDYSPTMTAVSHTGVGTGAPPRVHGIVSNILKDGPGKPRVAYRGGGNRVRPEDALAPTFAEAMDRHYGNRAVVLSNVYTDYPAVAMVGRGAGAPGGDRDFVTWHKKGGGLVTDERYYRIAPSLAARRADGYKPAGASSLRDMHAADWYARFEVDAVLRAMETEDIGADEVPDLVLVNFKSTDSFGHLYGHGAPGYAAALAMVDEFLGRAEDLLVRVAGEGRYLFAITADHGLVPDDGSRLIYRHYEEWLNLTLDARGDRDGKGPVHYLFGGMVYLRPDEAEDDGVTAADVAALLNSDPAMRHVFSAEQVRARVPAVTFR